MVEVARPTDESRQFFFLSSPTTKSRDFPGDLSRAAHAFLLSHVTSEGPAYINFYTGHVAMPCT